MRPATKLVLLVAAATLHAVIVAGGSCRENPKGCREKRFIPTNCEFFYDQPGRLPEPQKLKQCKEENKRGKAKEEKNKKEQDKRNKKFDNDFNKSSKTAIYIGVGVFFGVLVCVIVIVVIVCCCCRRHRRKKKKIKVVNQAQPTQPYYGQPQYQQQQPVYGPQYQQQQPYDTTYGQGYNQPQNY